LHQELSNLFPKTSQYACQRISHSRAICLIRLQCSTFDPLSWFDFCSIPVVLKALFRKYWLVISTVLMHKYYVESLLEAVFQRCALYNTKLTNRNHI
jgi:hypothetical protein